MKLFLISNKFKALFFVGFVTQFLSLNAQNTDLRRLLYLHDMLYYNRTSNVKNVIIEDRTIQITPGIYFDSTICKNLILKSDSILAQFDSQKMLRLKYPYTFYSTCAEYFALKASKEYLTYSYSSNDKLYEWLSSLTEALKTAKESYTHREIDEVSDIDPMGSINSLNDKAWLYDYYCNKEDGPLKEAIQIKLRKINGKEHYENEINYLLDVFLLIKYKANTFDSIIEDKLKIYYLCDKILKNVSNHEILKEKYKYLYDCSVVSFLQLKCEMMVADQLSISMDEKFETLDSLKKFSGTIYEKDRKHVYFTEYYYLDSPIWHEVLDSLNPYALLDLPTIIPLSTDFHTSFYTDLYLDIEWNRTISGLMNEMYLRKNNDQINGFAEIRNLYAKVKYIPRNYTLFPLELLPIDYIKSDTITNRIEKIFSYFNCRNRAKGEKSESLEYSFAKFLLLDLFENGFNKKQLDKLPLKKSRKNTWDKIGSKRKLPHISKGLWEKVYSEFFNKPDWEIIEAIYDKVKAFTDKSISPAFPWPPLPPTTLKEAVKFRSSGGINPKTYGEAAIKLNTQLDFGGYPSPLYFSVPGGFAAVARMEQIDKAGKHLSGESRFSPTPSQPKLWADYLKALFMGTKGKFRVMVFVFTDQQIPPFEKKKVSLKKMLETFNSGNVTLTDDEKVMPYTAKHKCWLFIYEFDKANDGEPAILVPYNTGLSVPQHLKNTILMNWF